MARDNAKDSSKLWLLGGLALVAVALAVWQFGRTVAPSATDVSFTTAKPAPPDGARRDASGNVIGVPPPAAEGEGGKTGTE